MIEQTGQTIRFEAFYTASKVGKTGLTVTVDVFAPDNSKVVTDGSATEVGGGLYSYTFSSTSTAGDYRAVFKTTDSTVSQKHLPSLWTVGTDWVENMDLAVSQAANAASNANTNAVATYNLVDSRLTATRAGNLDNLDAMISSRMPTGSVTLSSSERNAVATALLDLANGVETGYTVRGTLRLMAAVLAGELAGAGTSTITFKGLDDATTRIEATVDRTGNRTSILRDASDGSQ